MRSTAWDEGMDHVKYSGNKMSTAIKLRTLYYAWPFALCMVLVVALIRRLLVSTIFRMVHV